MRLTIALACLALAACAGRVPPDVAAPAGASPEGADVSTAASGPSTLTVDNRSWLDVVCYAVTDGTRQRLGTVGAAASRAFDLPPHALRPGADLRLVADPVGDRPFTSERVMLQPGQHVYWTLESDLARSSLLVR